MSDPNACFTLRVRLYNRDHDARIVTITAFDDLGWDSAGRVRLTCEVRHGGRVVFPRGQLTCALHGSSDGNAARELVMSMVGMHPSAGGGEGDDYYEDYTPEQMQWAETHGDALCAESAARYCNDNGSIRGAA